MKRYGMVAVAGLATLLVVSGVEAQETFRLSGPDVSVYNLAGKVDVVRGSGSDVVVRLTRGGSDGSRLEVRTGEIGGRQTLRVIYPDDQVVYSGMGRGSSSSLRVRDDGTFSDRDGGGGHRVRIRGSGSGLEAWADLTVEVPDGRDFALYVAVGAPDVRGVKGTLRIETGSGSVAATDVGGSLTVDTGSGSVRVTGMDGILAVNTGSGGVELHDVSGERVEIDTGSGGVRGSGVRAEQLRVDTGSGGIRLEQVSVPDIYLDTGSGSVEAELLVDVTRLDVDTGSGSVTIHAPKDLGAEVDIETGSGGIDVDFPVQVRKVRRDLLTGTIGDGNGRIRIDTGSGGVHLIRN